MKRVLALLLALCLCFGMCACDSNDDDPNLGKYIGVSGEMMGITLTMEELYPGESYLELKSGGKAELVLEGDKISGKWSLDGETFVLVVDGEECPGTLKNGVIIFDFIGSGMMLTFAKEGSNVSSGSNDESEGPLGLYQGTSYEYSGQKLQMSDIYNGVCTLELLSDGKCVLTLGGEKMDCTWTLDGETLIVKNVAADSPGTLKNGTASIDFMGMGMILTFVKGDGTATGNENADNIAGYYPLYAVDQDGEYTDNELITQIGMDRDNYIIINEDGTALVVMEGDKISCTYTENTFVEESGSEVSYAFVDGLLELYLENNMTFYYKKGDMADVPVDSPVSISAFPEDEAEAFSGDWHGWCVITYGTGEYEDNIDEEFEMLARYVFDEDGYCTPWMAICSDPESNFRDIVVTYDEEDYFAYLSGELFGMTIVTEYSYMYEAFGSISLNLTLEDENGTIEISVCMRHPGDAWDEYDFPCMPASAQEYYDGMTFEEMVALYGLDPNDLP